MIQVVLITRTGKAYLANGIAAFTLDKEAYTPYSQLTATVYGNFSIQQFTGIYRGTAAAGRHGTALRDSGKVPAGAGKRHLLCAVFLPRADGTAAAKSAGARATHCYVAGQADAGFRDISQGDHVGI